VLVRLRLPLLHLYPQLPYPPPKFRHYLRLVLCPILLHLFSHTQLFQQLNYLFGPPLALGASVFSALPLAHTKHLSFYKLHIFPGVDHFIG
jgi:hypothetical protein